MDEIELENISKEVRRQTWFGIFLFVMFVVFVAIGYGSEIAAVRVLCVLALAIMWRAVTVEQRRLKELIEKLEEYEEDQE